MDDFGARRTSVGVYLGGWIDCYTYEDGAPILSITTDTASLSVTVPNRNTIENSDVGQAWSLLLAVKTYAAELERLYGEQTGVPAREALGLPPRIAEAMA